MVNGDKSERALRSANGNRPRFVEGATAQACERKGAGGRWPFPPPSERQ